MKQRFIKYLPYIGLFAALTFVFTAISLTIPVGGPSGTLVHLGAAMAVAVAFFLPAPYAALSVAFGMALFDIISAYTMWAPFTFVIRFFQVLVLGSCLKQQKNKTLFMIIGFLLGAVIDVGGYYLAGAVIYKSWILPLTGIPVEIILNIVGIVLGLPAGLFLSKRLKFGKDLS